MILEGGIEAAVNRMTANGMTRLAALSALSDALTDAVSKLSAVGLADMARLRAQMITATVKLNAETKAYAEIVGMQDVG